MTKVGSVYLSVMTVVLDEFKSRGQLILLLKERKWVSYFMVFRGIVGGLEKIIIIIIYNSSPLVIILKHRICFR